MNAWADGSVVSHQTKLHYYRTNGDGPPVVLLHGITDDGLCWTPVAIALEDRFDVIMIDQRGHGKSEAPENGWDYETMANEVAGLIEALELNSPVVMGHSMGAFNALVIASLFPDLARGYILEDPPPFWIDQPPTEEAVENRKGMLMWFSEMKRLTKDELLASVRKENPGWSEAELSPWADSKQRFSPMISNLVEHTLPGPMNWLDKLKQVHCPIMLITADQARGAILGEVEVQGLRKYLPDLQWVYLPGAGHNIRREQFEKYMEAVDEFLSSL